MLRVFKPTSPLSVGSWILAPFGGLGCRSPRFPSSRGCCRGLGRLGGARRRRSGRPLATYTGALISNTAVPAWHEGFREMPFLFAGSASTAAAGDRVDLRRRPSRPGPARLTGDHRRRCRDYCRGAACFKRLGMVAEPYQQGRPGVFMTVGEKHSTIAGVAAAVPRSAPRSAVGAGRGELPGGFAADPLRGVPGRPGVGQGPEVHRRTPA